MATRIGVDIGGTFTDLIFFDDESGDITVAKVRSTPAVPEEGVLSAVATAIPPDRVRAAQFFLHGTTVALNTLLQRNGAVLGLLVTRGFRDIPEIRRGDREEMYNLVWAPPPPLVPRRLRLPVDERVRADGVVLQSLVEDGIAAALEVFRQEGVTAIAVTFLHSYANPQNELAAEAALRRLGFTGELSLSHRVSGEYREYERMSTTLVDAYVRPKSSQYLRRLEKALREVGFAGRCLLTRSGGGAMTFLEGQSRPVEAILSGPVAGAQGAGAMARILDLPEVVTADVGGTSFDTCLIMQGRPEMMYEGSVIGMPLQIPWIDVRSIGAGGGSIAYADIGGLLRVGPASAGAEPGPVAYGRGGTSPTVTDAALFLGMLADGSLAGGVRLDIDLATDALAHLASDIGLGTQATAQGILRIAAANMADAIREITIERGRDPRRAALLAFGGAGPLVAALLARELDIRSVVIPPHAGNFSAWGLLRTDITRTRSRTQIMPLTEASLGEAAATALALFEELEASGDAAPVWETALDMRYSGQEHTLSIPVTLRESGAGFAEDVSEMEKRFAVEYGQVFAHALDESVGIVHVRATLRVKLPQIEQPEIQALHDGAEAEGETWRTFSFLKGDWMDFALVDRTALHPGAVLIGPAVVREPTATTYVDCGFEVRTHPSGALLMVDVDEPRGPRKPSRRTEAA